MMSELRYTFSGAEIKAMQEQIANLQGENEQLKNHIRHLLPLAESTVQMLEDISRHDVLPPRARVDVECMSGREIINAADMVVAKIICPKQESELNAKTTETANAKKLIPYNGG